MKLIHVLTALIMILGCASELVAQTRGEGHYHQPSPDQSSVKMPPAETEQPPSLTPEEIEQRLRKARALTALGKTDAAIILYYEILASEPDHVIALDDLLKLFFHTDNWAMAISTLEHLGRLQPENAVIREALSLIYHYYDLYHRALPVELELIRLAPHNEKYLAALAETLNNYNLLDEVLTVLERLHALDPANVEYITRIASIYYWHNKLDLSIAYYEKLAALLPDNPAIPLKIARLTLENRDLSNAMRMYEDALQRAPDHTLLQEEMNYVYAEVARDYFARDRLTLAKQYFLRSAQGDYPYPFAAEYVRETEAEMSFKALYDFSRERYKFAGDTVRTMHTGGFELPIFAFINRCHLLARRATIEDQLYTFHVRDVQFEANLEFHRQFQGTFALGYSQPENAVNTEDALVYSLLWTAHVNPRNQIQFGIDRKRVLHSSEAVDKSIFSTEYSALYGRFFLDDQVWSAVEYKYGTYTGGNDSHLLNVDLAYTPLKRLRIPDDIESKPPLFEDVQQNLDLGLSLEYTTFKYPSDLYFTLHDQLFGFARGEYRYSPVEDLYFIVNGSVGRSFKKDETVARAAAGVRYLLPFRVHLDGQYMRNQVISAYQGHEDKNIEHLISLSCIWYF